MTPLATVKINVRQYNVKLNGRTVQTTLKQTKGAVVTIAKQGPRGLQGLPGNALPPINFSFGDASPATIFTLTQRSLITEVTVIVRTPFDGAGAALRIGTIAAPESLLAATQNVPNQAAQYTTSPDADLAANTNLILSITPGVGATQGSGIIVIALTPIV